jgi:hypothetical protein
LYISSSVNKFSTSSICKKYFIKAVCSIIRRLYDPKNGVIGGLYDPKHTLNQSSINFTLFLCSSQMVHRQMAHSPNGSFAKWYIRQISHKPFVTRVYVRTTRVYHLLCCWSCSCSCSSWDISQNTAVYTKLVPFHHGFSILQCNLQFAILIFNFNFRFSIFDFYLISFYDQFRPDCPIQLKIMHYCPISPCF